MTTTAEQLVRPSGFRIAGEWLTEHCRTLAYGDHNWRLALATLVDGLAGFGYDNAVAVLRGEKKLVGVNEVELVDEDPAAAAAVKLESDRLYGGVFRNNRGENWKPYAYVTSWCAEDLGGPGRWGRNRFNPFPRPGKYSGDTSADKFWRSLFYADSPLEDWVLLLRMPETELSGLVYPVPSQQLVLWQLCDPPVWTYTFREPQLALDEWLKHPSHRLERRGGHGLTSRIFTGDVNPAAVPPTVAATAAFVEQAVEKTDSLLKEMYMERTAAQGISAKDAEANLAYVEGTQDRTSKPYEEKSLNHAHAWVSPDGHFYPCAFHEHDALAARILKHLCGEAPPDGLNACDRRLEELGWMKITEGMDGSLPRIVMGLDRKATKKQWGTAFDWCEKHSVDYRKAGLEDDLPKGDGS